jgi:hypothetical protein
VNHGKDDALPADALAIALSAAVPLWILEVRGWTQLERAERAAACAAIVSMGEKQDEVRGRHGAGPALLANGEIASGSNEGGPAAVFTAIACGLAILSYQPGGIFYAGRHWETKPGPVRECRP